MGVRGLRWHFASEQAQRHVRTTGEPVEVAAERTERVTVFANGNIRRGGAQRMAGLSGRRQTSTAAMAVVVGLAVLAMGCGTDVAASGSRSPSPKHSALVDSSATADAVRAKVLHVGEVKGVMPDAAALPGWRDTEPLVTEDRFLCERVVPRGCRNTVAIGTVKFLRGKKMSKTGGELTFTFYSCTSERTARELFAELYLRGSKTRLPGSLGDERAAVHETLSAGGQAVVLASTKVRAGTAVLWVTAAGGEQHTTEQRSREAAELFHDRFERARTGERPTTSARID
ncbi:hypothetical protein [Streptomyces sp. NPDC048002]|uniref:hypothetical protein n=1 Tax=unclassified Streptomyces TaxID=2593676 RepID=UPI003407057A